MKNRRDFLTRVFGLGAGLAALPSLSAAEPSKRHPSMTSAPPVTVVTPDVPDLAWRMVDGAKEFHLIAEPVKQEIVPGKVLDLWGYNGSAPGPTIQVSQGDRVRIIVDNHLPEPTAMHWHGFEVSNNMDGAPGVSQDPIPPGGRFVYEFTLHQAGTFFYHSHMAMQEMMGMLGAFIMHPKEAYSPRVDKDFAILLQEYAVLPNNSIPNSMNMEFNWLTFNGKSAPATTPLIVRLNDRVRVRLINLGMDHHPVHLHGHTFVVTGTEGGRQPQSSWGPKNTVLVGVSEAYDIEFVANNSGDWMIHCHLPHHMMNQMASMVGPMTRGGAGMPAGLDMERGMGMAKQGSATSPENGPSLGRGLGVGANQEEAVSNGSMQEMPGMSHGAPGAAEMPEISQNASRVPGFPQDAFMESPMMAMDKMVDKAETHGLRAGWSGFAQGMMTFLRVLPPELYDKITELQEKKKTNPQPVPEMEHPHHG